MQIEKYELYNIFNTNYFSEYKRKFWQLFAYGFLGVILLFLFASWGFFGKMPSFDDLENPDSNVATEIISSDGVVIGKFFKENRTPVKYEELPQHLVKALVATEDERFYEHSGIDAKGTLRAVVRLGRDGGASTLTQQLAKNLFHGEGSKFILFRVIQKVKDKIKDIQKILPKDVEIASVYDRSELIEHSIDNLKEKLI